MNAQMDLTDPQSTGEKLSDKSQIHMQEQFIKQVKDDSLPAYKVLTDRNDILQKADHAIDDSVPLFVP